MPQSQLYNSFLLQIELFDLSPDTIGVIVVAVGAVVFIIKLEGRINTLGKQLKQLEEHPFFVLYKKWQLTKGVALFYDDLLRSREVATGKEG